jgi:hypothetical protein
MFSGAIAPIPHYDEGDVVDASLDVGINCWGKLRLDVASDWCAREIARMKYGHYIVRGVSKHA